MRSDVLDTIREILIVVLVVMAFIESFFNVQQAIFTMLLVIWLEISRRRD